MPLTIDHAAIVVPAAKLDDFVNFLVAALEPLGLKEMMRPIPTSVGLGDQTPFFWVSGIEGDAQTLALVMENEHTAFSANGRYMYHLCQPSRLSKSRRFAVIVLISNVQTTSLSTGFTRLLSKLAAKTMVLLVRGRSIILGTMVLLLEIRFVGLILRL